MTEHGTHSKYVQGCRCELCTEAHRAYNAETRQNRKQLEPSEHGLTGYSDYGCRCPICTEANAAHVREWRERQ